MALDPDALAAVNAKARRLRELVRAEPILVMPGAFDALSAKLFEHLGFPAIQCSSGAIAAALGRPDGERLSREETVEASRRIAQAVSVPVNADGERGYGDVADMGETVRAFLEAGCVGMNLEDSLPHGPGQPAALAPVAAQLEKIAAVLAARERLGAEFFLNARVDAFMTQTDDPAAALREAVARGQAYAAAGGDCIFFMRAETAEVIRTLVSEIPAPVSVLAGPRTPPVAELQDLGVARVSYGSAFGRQAIGAVRRLALEIRDHGTITAVADGMTGPEVAAVIGHRH
jgi:2-methylisocitrate lyase-like PEP mutase family enzyme